MTSRKGGVPEAARTGASVYVVGAAGWTVNGAVPGQNPSNPDLPP